MEAPGLRGFSSPAMEPRGLRSDIAETEQSRHRPNEQARTDGFTIYDGTDLNEQTRHNATDGATIYEKLTPYEKLEKLTAYEKLKGRSTHMGRQRSSAGETWATAVPSSVPSSS